MTNLNLTIDEQGLALLDFDRPGSPANIFDATTLDELATALDEIESNEKIGNLIFTSSKPSIFIAGADIKSIASSTTEELDTFLRKGQELFDRIADLRCGTAAAIHGACLGGGFELALACDIRVASLDQSTKIGLPETLLGIIPSWGGSTRLPKLIGVQKSLSLILAGKKMAPKYAKKLGAVDDVVPRERLVERCLQLLKKRPERDSHWKTNNFAAAKIAKAVATKDVMKRTRGHYPAMLEAIDVVTAAPLRSHASSLKAERDAALELAGSETTRQMIRLFFLTEKSKKGGVDVSGEVPKIDHVTVVGAGVMGAGIAHWTASRKIPVLLKDINEEAVARGLKTISKRFAEAVDRRIFTPGEAAERQNMVSPAAENVPMKHTDLIVEAAVENMGIKRKIFAELASRTRPDAILATNTSALSIEELSTSIPNPERVVGLHFFNPVHRMKLVEVIYTSETKPEVTQACLNFVRKIGKSPVLVQDSPGFLVNRILMPYLIEAGRLFQKGIPPKKIDEAMLDFGMPVGPIQLLDDIGLDVALHVAETMESFFEDRMRVPKVLKKLVKAEVFGRKSGKGIYLYGGSNKGKVNREALNFVHNDLSMSKTEIAQRLSLLMVAESYRCLQEGIVASADDIDFAMIMGTGWAPFRGGPMAYANTIGEDEVIDKLTSFSKKDPAIYRVPKSLISG
ncbi:MAG: 3-hydroxyacyl-CoA dehydrogenase NAD-binding domain-containing protein [Verrucomicrobiales bacterium]|nr:3-hydroxyacyl-CoA dehydrogenase NAD-binding domain-containing protein [Verrucomicrobiales bacterium]